MFRTTLSCVPQCPEIASKVNVLVRRLVQLHTKSPNKSRKNEIKLGICRLEKLQISIRTQEENFNIAIYFLPK